MLKHIKEWKAAEKLENAVASVIKEGKHVTYDLMPAPDSPNASSTSEMAQAIVAKLKDRG